VTIDDAVRLEGREEIRTIVTSDAHQAILPGCAHVMGPFTVEVSGDGATATGYATVYVAGKRDGSCGASRSAGGRCNAGPRDGGCSAASRGASGGSRRRKSPARA
jgi:SnoaL-like domain